ncbi:hypothetical protein NEAUS03_0309 [Nematocida ausubeli]|nr:hypothetical protein NEAUS03_0309 [Nematocida ausubeli]
MEEILRSVYEYSDELLLELLQEEQTLEAAVNILCGVIRSITAQEILREKEQLLLLYRYLLMLVRMPEMFDFEGRSISRTVEIFYGACMHHKLPLHTTLSGNEIGEEILTVLLHGVYRKMDHPSEPGRYANYSSPSRIEENSSYNLSVHEDLLKHPMATRILEKKSLWGLEPILPTGEDEWVHMQCRNSRIFNLTQSYILNLCPVYYTGEHIGIYMMYPEFYNKTKAEIQRARASLQKVVDQTNTRFFSIFKSLIMFNKDIKKNFISSIYSIYENNKEREKTRYKLEEVQPDAKIFTISNLLGRLIQPVANDTIKMQSIPADTLQRSEYLKSTQFPIATSTPCMTNSMTNMNSPSDISSRADAPKTNDTFLSELFYGKLLYNRISYTQIYTNYNAYTEDMRRTERAIASAPNDQRMKYVLSILNSELEYINALLACDTMRTEVVFLMYTVSFLNHMAHKGRLSTVPVFILENIIISLERLTHMKLGIRLTQEDVKKVHILCIHVLNSRININYKQEVIKLLLTYINTSECEYTPGIVLSIIMYFIDVQIEIRNQSEQLQERGRASCILDYLLENYKGKEEIRGILETSHSTSDHKDTKTVFLLHLLSSLVDAQERGFEELRKVSRAQRESEPAESIDTYIEHSNSYFYIVDVIDRIIFTLMDVSGKAFSSSLIMCRLASLLNASLITLVSKKSSELKLNSSKSTFSPVTLLGNRVKMYISLKTMAFVKAVAEDEDMFKPELFSKAIEICDRKGVLTQRDKAYAILFIKRVANLKEQRTVSSITYPDEFIDPLTFGLMKDPVILRTSNTRVDRSTAAMILMTDPTDPFTRDPLTEEDILEDHEMHKIIHDFLAKHT